MLFGDSGLSCDAAELRVELRAGDATELFVGVARAGVSTSPEGAQLNSVFGDEDIAAHVRRKSDGEEFTLALAEWKAVEKRSSNDRL